ncbi:MAG: SEC-C metal-binding domain-containing protein [Casimicrobiaceae bacterium]
MNRNDPCPCGSGKRYKHCHGSVEPAAPRALHLEALDLLWNAAEQTGWTDPRVRKNLGLVLAKFLAPQADARQEALVAAYIALARA